MLGFLGLLTVVILLAAIISKKMSPLVALIIIPVAAALIGGFGQSVGTFIVKGIQNIAPVAAMTVFAILFFGIMTDAGMFDPLIDRILRAVGNHPPRIVMGTALLAAVVMLDGSGAITFLITIPVMLPLYERLGMDRRVLACAVSLAAGLINILPWGGPTIRAAAALQIPVTDVFNPLIPVLGVGLIYLFLVTYWLGRREAKRLCLKDTDNSNQVFRRELSEEDRQLRRPRLFWINTALTAILMGVLLSGTTEPVVVFMLGTVVALMLNYPNVDAQRRRIEAHAKASLMMASILLSAGAFTGIMKESGMLTAMAGGVVDHLPAGMATHIPFLLGLVSMPLSLLFDPDSFYFGVLPVVAEVTGGLGGQPIQVAQGALLGQMTTGFPVSPLTPATYLLVGLVGVDLGEHQKFTTPYLFGASVVMTLASVAFRVFSV